MDAHLTRASRFLALVLRHKPEVAHICLDDNGWADIEALLGGAKGANVALTHELLELVVETNPKRRFAIDDTGTRIRAVQGHSVDVDLAYVPARQHRGPKSEPHPGTRNRTVSVGPRRPNAPRLSRQHWPRLDACVRER